MKFNILKSQVSYSKEIVSLSSLSICSVNRYRTIADRVHEAIFRCGLNWTCRRNCDISFCVIFNRTCRRNCGISFCVIFNRYCESFIFLFLEGRLVLTPSFWSLFEYLLISWVLGSFGGWWGSVHTVFFVLQLCEWYLGVLWGSVRCLVLGALCAGCRRAGGF